MASVTTSSLTQRRSRKEKAPATKSVGVQNAKISEKKAKAKPSFRIIDLFDGIGGTVNFSFFRTPTWVDLSLPPGTTSQEEMVLSHPKLWSLISGHYILYSPNLVWFLIALAIYIFAPYDMEAAKENSWRSEWFQRRFMLNASIMLLYYGFWHTTLYGLGWAHRPFVQGRVYRFSKLFHNLYYCLLGILQWTAWEMVMVHLYASGRIGYQTNDEIFASWKGFANFFASCLFVPIFREAQFFFAHRMIHFRCLYKYIHALHHRNTDVEPFSGICMSPAEHLYYISSIAPSIYWHASPFQFLWNGTHLLLSPGASHSGWEDHWHSDQFHAVHHRYFEVNLGTPSMPFDRWFGTFRETMAPQTKCYHGDAVEAASAKGSPIIKARADSKATLWGLPSWDQMIYHVAIAIGLPLLVSSATIHRDDGGEGTASFWLQAPFVALAVSIGPLILAAILSLITASPPVTSLEKFKYTMFYPCHKESFFGGFGISILLGILCSLMPIYHFIHSLLVEDPQDTIYHRIWG